MREKKNKKITFDLWRDITRLLVRILSEIFDAASTAIRERVHGLVMVCECLCLPFCVCERFA